MMLGIFNKLKSSPRGLTAGSRVIGLFCKQKPLDAAPSRGMTAWGCIAVLAFGLAACDQEPVTSGGPATMRRLTEAQYRTIVADVFGSHIVIAGRFDPLQRTGGLLAIGAGRASMTQSGLERAAGMAKAIAQQVVNDTNRAVLIPCTPANAATRDDACATTTVDKIGRLLFRRPLTGDETATYVKIAGSAADTRKDFYAGLSYALQGLLSAPDFLFITETTADGNNLDAYAKASRLSFALWNSTPDDTLLKAAASGALDTDKGVAAEVDRMIASPRLANGMRAFFTDAWALDDFATLEKDTLIYPAFTMTTTLDAKEQLLRTVEHHLLDKNADYRDLFVTRDTFVSRALGMVYRIPASNPTGWVPYTFPEGDARAGIQNLPGFVALRAHPGKSSPTLRGKAIRELLLCQRVPDPPAEVNFDQFNDPNSPAKTARARLDLHSNEPACSGCHKIMDPIGLAQEHFDGAGQLRKTENGEAIDASGELDGIKFSDAVGLGQAMRVNPAAPACVVNRLYAYSVGRAVESGEKDWMRALEMGFAEDDYRFTALLKRIVTSRAFLAVKPAATTSAATEGPRSRQWRSGHEHIDQEALRSPRSVARHGGWRGHHRRPAVPRLLPR